jgi:Ala-tRNA(Pro) deacylase
MPLARLREFLDTHKVRYVVISHSVAYTAQGIAALTHISGKEWPRQSS